MTQDQKYIVRETPLILQHIKKHKKWYEKYILFSYALYMNNTYYYYVQYLFRNKVIGYLILQSNGEILPYEEAKLTCKYIDSFNACMGTAAQELTMDKELSTGIWETKLHHFQLLKEEQQLPLSEITEEIDKICDVCEQYLRRQERLKEIHSEIVECHSKSVGERRYITVDDYKLANNLIFEYKTIIYRVGRLKLNTSTDAQKIIDFIQCHKDKIWYVNTKLNKFLKVH